MGVWARIDGLLDAPKESRLAAAADSDDGEYNESSDDDGGKRKRKCKDGPSKKKKAKKDQARPGVLPGARRGTPLHL